MFRQYNSRFEDKNAQVLGISCDPVSAHRAWTTALGGMPYPVLSDWHPHGKATKDYGLWNEERSVGRRAVFVVDKEGIVRFGEIYTGEIPDPAAILAEVEKLG